MRISHVIESISPHFGGPPSVVMHLAAAQAALGAEVDVVTYANPGNQRFLEEWRQQIPAARDVQLQEVGDGWRSALRNRRAFRALHGSNDVLHIHGIWRPLAWHALSVARASSRAATVLAPHGMLSPWALHHHGFRKKLALGALWRRLIRAADLLHAVSRGEKDEIEAVITGARIALIPNGVSTEETGGFATRTAAVSVVPKAGAYVLYLARLHEMKGPDLLIEAFAAVVRNDERYSAYRLVMAGPDFGEKAELQARVRRLGIEDRVDFPGPVFGRAKQALYQGASLVCQPSRYEAFSLSLLEAAAAGVPVLTTPEANFPEIDTSGGGVVCRGDARELATHMRRLLKQPALRETMGLKGRALVLNNYTWERVAAGALKVYRDTLMARKGSL